MRLVNAGHLLGIILVMAWSAPLIHANDTAASASAGGIRLVREAHISMEKERLTISEKKITVEYEFLNNTDADITTEVAFPVPPFKLGDDDPGGPRGLDDFRVWIEGKQVNYQTDVRATHNGVDYTSLLHELGVDVSSFGHFDEENMSEPFAHDIQKLSSQSKDRLMRAGLIGRENKFPRWAVSKTYHWNQTFPAHQTIRVRHEYAPVIGFTPVDFGYVDPVYRKQIDTACVDPGLQKTIISVAKKNQKNYVEMFWVDYILTTANSWKTPIKDFEMILEKPKSAVGHPSYVSLCWDGSIERIDSEHFRAKISNFVPKQELHVTFFLWP